MWKSAPSGSATSSRKKVPSVLPVTRLTTSPSRWPKLSAWYPLCAPGSHIGSCDGQQAHDAVPVVERLGRDGLRESRQTRGVAQQIADRERVLSRLRELGPVAGDGSVEIQLAAIDEHQRAESGHGLRRRVDIDDGVLLPGAPAGLVGVPGPEVDHEFAIDVAAKQAPISSPSSKFLAKARFTSAKRGSQVPQISRASAMPDPPGCSDAAPAPPDRGLAGVRQPL